MLVQAAFMYVNGKFICTTAIDAGIAPKRLQPSTSYSALENTEENH